MYKHELENSQMHLDELLSFVGVGIWDWDIKTHSVVYSTAWAQMLGYSVGELPPVVDTWVQMVLPQDLTFAYEQLDKHISVRSSTYEAQFRMVRKDKSIIWVQDKGHVTEYDSDGKALHFIGAMQDITSIKNTELRLLENQENLENTIEKHRMEMVEQDKLLWTVNQVSRKLLTDQVGITFESLEIDCLRLLGESINQSRVHLWADGVNAEDKVCCRLIYEWVSDVAPICCDAVHTGILYDDLPCINAAIEKNRCVNSTLTSLSESEKKILGENGVKTVLIAPIAINGKRWGFVGVDNCRNERLFTHVEETMLLMSGSLMANAIERMETEAALREMEERTQLILNAMPLCCNMWTANLSNMLCNDEAVRLFELSSQDEYLERFYELSPEYQNNGRRSDELSVEYITKAFTDGYYRFEWQHQKVDGTPIPAEITLVRIKYRDRFIVAGYTRDLREQKAMLKELQTKDALKRARDEALMNSKAKSNFLANMSHEIRTPMNAISGFAEIILRDSADERIAEYAKGIKGACGSLINIINDILDITKIESGKLEIFQAPYDLASLISDVITISRMRLGSKPLIFITDIDSKLPARLVGDEVRIKQILINMLSNAIKYTPDGYIKLKISGTVVENEATLYCSVQDSGVGIKAEDKERLFGEFERVNTTKDRSVEGTGLGLAISKQLCEIMGGCIKVESTYGEGSEFVAVIPQHYQAYKPLSQVKSEKTVLLYEPRETYCMSITETLKNLNCGCVPCANQSELYDSIGKWHYDYIFTAALYLKKVKAILKKNNLSIPVAAFLGYGEKVSDDKVQTIPFPVNCLQLATLLNGEHEEGISRHDADAIGFIAPSAHVLVVDDNLVNLQVAKGLMEPYQFFIDTAENGIVAVRMVQQREYDMVFMDHMMPEMDGIDATAAIRQLDGRYYQELPIIALTANAVVGTREMFIHEGMNDFLAKPIEINKLAQMLMRWLPPAKIVKSMPKIPTNDTEDVLAYSIAGVNTAQGISSVGGSRENYLKILSAYYMDGKHKCSTLLEHTGRGDIPAFCTEIHALKSTSATIGALKVSLMAAKLEAAARNNGTAYINDHLDEFIDSLQGLLESILPIISPFLPTSDHEIILDTRPSGEVTYLMEMLELLKDAVDFVNIGQIEDILDKLQQFRWADEFSRELATLQNQLKVFDYDSMLESIVKLEGILHRSSQ